MKILFMLQFPIPIPNAPWARASFFAEYLSGKGHKVSISGVFSAKTQGKVGLRKWNGLQLIIITPMILIPLFPFLLFNILSSFLSSIVLMIWLRPQLVIISVPHGESAFGSYLVSKIFRKRIVIDYRDEWEDYVTEKANSKIYKWSYKFFKTLMTRCYVNSDHVITVTEPFANSLSVRGVRNVKVITNGADTNVFKPYDKVKSRDIIGFDESDFIILYSGGIGGYYRLDIVVKAMGKLLDKVKNIKLLLVGNGPDVESVLRLSKEINIQNKIFYLGPKHNRNELAEILSAADIGIIPYDANPLWKNSLPAKSFEYLACGLPVIATVYKDSILGKLILENNIGLVSEPENVDALADCIEKMYNDDFFRKTASKNAVLLVKDRFDRNTIAEEFLNLLKC